MSEKGKVRLVFGKDMTAGDMAKMIYDKAVEVGVIKSDSLVIEEWQE